jgi:hypothetical protein
MKLLSFIMGLSLHYTVSAASGMVLMGWIVDVPVAGSWPSWFIEVCRAVEQRRFKTLLKKLTEVVGEAGSPELNMEMKLNHPESRRDLRSLRWIFAPVTFSLSLPHLSELVV